MQVVLENQTKTAIDSFSSLVWKRFRKHKLAVYSLFLLIFLSLLSIFAPLIQKILGVSNEIASIYEANQSSGYPHLLGTNELGQDLFLRLIYGGRISLAVGFLAATASAIIGSVIGILSGYFGGKIDSLLMRFTDAMLSVPVLPLMIVFSALDLKIFFSSEMSETSFYVVFIIFFSFFLLVRFLVDQQEKKRQAGYFFSILKDSLLISGLITLCYALFFYFVPWKAFGSGNFASVIKLITIIVFFGWMPVARLARASTMQLKGMDFIVSSNALGASHYRILFHHILPNVLAPIIVTATLEVGGNILYEAALSFLGLGIQPPVSSWGNMLNNAVDYIKTNPNLAFWPGFFILVTVACFNFLGDGLRDAFDPHQVMKNAK